MTASTRGKGESLSAHGGAKQNSSFSSSLTRTVTSFAERIGRELEELAHIEAEEDKLRREKGERLDALLSKIGGELLTATTVHLGERFKLALTELSRNNKPAYRVHLVDIFVSKELVLAVEVYASSEKDAGRICFGELGTPGESLDLSSHDAAERAELRLRRTLRIFFDKVRAYMLDPRRKEEAISFRNSEAKTLDVEEDRFLEDVDVFSEDLVVEDVNTLRPEDRGETLAVELSADDAHRPLE